MADSFTSDHIQGIYGEFTAVLDIALAFTYENIQGIYGEFKPLWYSILDSENEIRIETAERKAQILRNRFISMIRETHLLELVVETRGRLKRR